MTTAAIRRKLHDYLEIANEKKIKAIYTMVEDEINKETEGYSDEFKAELDRRFETYQKDGAVISREQMDKNIKKMLNK